MEQGVEGMSRVQFQDTCISKATILYCCDLAYACGDKDLYDLFASICPYGVRQAKVFRGRRDQPLGYGFVELVSEEDLDIAIMHLNGVELYGRNIMYAL